MLVKIIIYFFVCWKCLHKNPSILLAKQVFAYLDHCTKSQANLDYCASGAWEQSYMQLRC